MWLRKKDEWWAWGKGYPSLSLVLTSIKGGRLGLGEKIHEVAGKWTQKRKGIRKRKWGRAPETTKLA